MKEFPKIECYNLETWFKDKIELSHDGKKYKPQSEYIGSSEKDLLQTIKYLASSDDAIMHFGKQINTVSNFVTRGELIYRALGFKEVS